MAIVTDLNGCFVSVNGDVDLIGGVIKRAKPWLKINCVSSPRAKFIKFGVDSEGKVSAVFANVTPSPEFNEIYFRNGEFHDCAIDEEDKTKTTKIGVLPITDTPDDYEVREMGGFKIGEVVSYYRNKSFARCGITAQWNDDEVLKIIAFTHIRGKWLPVVKHVKRQQISPIVFDCIKKKMTDAETKARVIEELADNACEELFGYSIQNCRDDVANTVRAMIEGDYRKQ